MAETPAWMTLEDITRDGRVLLTVEDSRMGISGFGPDEKQERDLSWFDASRVYDISADGKHDPVRGDVVWAAAQYGDLSAKNGWQPGNTAGRRQPAAAVAGRQMGGVHRQRRTRTTLTLLPTGAGEMRKLPRAWNQLRARGMVSRRAETSDYGKRTGEKEPEPLCRIRTAGMPFPSRPKACAAAQFLRTRSM